MRYTDWRRLPVTDQQEAELLESLSRIAEAIEYIAKAVVVAREAIDAED